MKTIIIDVKHEFKILKGINSAGQMTLDELTMDYASALLLSLTSKRIGLMTEKIDNIVISVIAKANRELLNRFNKEKIEFKAKYNLLDTLIEVCAYTRTKKVDIDIE